MTTDDIIKLTKPALWFDMETGHWKVLSKPDRPTYEPYYTREQMREFAALIRAEALAEQEPVAWRRRERGGEWQYFGWQETGMTHELVARCNKDGFECEAIPAPQPAKPAEPVARRLMDCDDCGGTGVDGDVDDRGLLIDVPCGSCAGSGKSRYLGKCADGKRCLQGCLTTEGCYWEKRAAKEQPAQQQEPVALLHDDGYWTAAKTDAGRRLSERLLFAGSPSIAVYTSPQPAKREPLTDEQIELMANEFEEGYVFLYRRFARAIERAHGIGEQV